MDVVPLLHALSTLSEVRADAPAAVASSLTHAIRAIESAIDERDVDDLQTVRETISRALAAGPMRFADFCVLVPEHRALLGQALAPLITDGAVTIRETVGDGHDVGVWFVAADQAGGHQGAAPT